MVVSPLQMGPLGSERLVALLVSVEACVQRQDGCLMPKQQKVEEISQSTAPAPTSMEMSLAVAKSPPWLQLLLDTWPQFQLLLGNPSS